MWEEGDWDSRSLASETVFARSSPILGIAQHSAGLPLAQHCHHSPLCWPLVAGLPVACQLACPGWTSASMRGGPWVLSLITPRNTQHHLDSIGRACSGIGRFLLCAKM